MESARKIVPLA
ncbi:hypothetical protein AYI70_g8435, partial [Smittium culicis]